MNFGLINDLSDGGAKKLFNSSYLEDLTGLLKKVASKLNSDEYYLFEDEYYIRDSKNPNSSYSEFEKEFINSFLYNPGGKIHIIRGQSGIGKSLFFEKGIQKLIRNKINRKDKYIKLGIDFRAIPQKKDVDFYERMIYKIFKKNAIDAIRRLGSNKIFSDFTEKYTRFIGGLDETPDVSLFPAMFFCREIYTKYGRPCIIIFDNIDLSCGKTQKRVFEATSKVCIALNDFMSYQDCSKIYCLYFAMRPETIFRRKDTNPGDYLNFPLPNVFKISLEILKRALWDTANELQKEGNVKCEIDFFDVIENKRIEIKTFMDAANYFVRILDTYLVDLWKDDIEKKLGTNEEFHCDLVNSNIRTFLEFLSDVLSNGGFKPFTSDFNNKENMTPHYNTFDYIEMIIRGRWKIFPGNKYIDGEGGNGAPIVFNIFDTSQWGDTQEIRVQHFLLYLSILRYFKFHAIDGKASYEELEKYLDMFFEKENIIKATKILIYVRMLYSFFEGDKTIADKDNWHEVIIDSKIELKLNRTGKFYMNKLVYEFEYLYQMALSSLMPFEYVRKLLGRKHGKEVTVLYFLEGILEILKINIEKFNKCGLRTKEDLSYINIQEDNFYLRMVKDFISTMNKKTQRAELMETKNMEKLRSLLCDAQKLEKDVECYFKT